MNNKQISVVCLASALTLPMVFSGGSSALAISLQTLLDDITLSGPGIDTVNDRTGSDVFTNTGTGNSTSSFMFEFAEGDPNSKFGIYNIKKPGQKVQLFDGPNYSGASSTVRFTGSQIVVTTLQIDPITELFVNSVPFNVQFYDYSWNKFGFYLEQADGTTLFTQDGLNGGDEHALVFRGDDVTVMDLPGRHSGTFTDNEFIIAFDAEGLGDDSDRDYDNFVVMVESIKPVPEPGTIAALGVVGVSLFATRRRKKGNGKKDK